MVVVMSVLVSWFSIDWLVGWFGWLVGVVGTRLKITFSCQYSGSVVHDIDLK